MCTHAGRNQKIYINTVIHLHDIRSNNYMLLKVEVINNYYFSNQTISLPLSHPERIFFTLLARQGKNKINRRMTTP